MKTSLNLDDKLFKQAKTEAAKTGKTISEIISLWASLGRQSLKQKVPVKFVPVDLGSPQIDLTNRKQWMDELE